MTARKISTMFQIKIPSRRGPRTPIVMSRHGLSVVGYMISVWNNQSCPIRYTCSYSCLHHGHQNSSSKQLLSVLDGHPSVCHVWRRLKSGGVRAEANYPKDNEEGDEFDIKLNNVKFWTNVNISQATDKLITTKYSLVVPIKTRPLGEIRHQSKSMCII